MMDEKCIELAIALEILENAADYASSVDECTEHAIRQCISAIKKIPTIDPIRAAGGCRCGECRFEEDCEKQVTIIRRDHVLEQNVYEHRRVEWCGAGEPKEAQDDG